MANDKVLSIRADEETIERLNALADQSGMKKAEILQLSYPHMKPTESEMPSRSVLPISTTCGA